jgi:hypothetical protein
MYLHGTDPFPDTDLPFHRVGYPMKHEQQQPDDENTDGGGDSEVVGDLSITDDRGDNEVRGDLSITSDGGDNKAGEDPLITSDDEDSISTIDEKYESTLAYRENKFSGYLHLQFNEPFPDTDLPYHGARCPTRYEQKQPDDENINVGGDNEAGGDPSITSDEESFFDRRRHWRLYHVSGRTLKS